MFCYYKWCASVIILAGFCSLPGLPNLAIKLTIILKRIASYQEKLKYRIMDKIYHNGLMGPISSN